MPGYYILEDEDLSECRTCRCGGRPELILDFVQDFEVRCQSCHTSTMAYMKMADAIRAWESGETPVKMDLLIDDVEGALSGELEYVVIDNDWDFRMLSKQSCEGSSVTLKFMDKPYLLWLEGPYSLDMLKVIDCDPENGKKLTPPEGTSASLLGIQYLGRYPRALKYRWGDRYLYISAGEELTNVCISKYDLFEGEDTLIPDDDASALEFEEN